MRKDDHQIHFDMQALLVSEKVDQSIIYRSKDFDMSYINVGNIPVEDITLIHLVNETPLIERLMSIEVLIFIILMDFFTVCSFLCFLVD